METEFLEELQSILEENDYPSELTDRCELLECLSHKDGCETFLAKNRADGALLVVKCYAQTHPMFSAAEPAAIRALCHPALPEFIVEYKTQTMRCVVRRYVEGQPLSEQKIPMPPEQVLAIGKQLCQVLAYLHGQIPPVIHRDIKPQNVIFSSDGRVSLIDFGISRLYSETGKTDTVAFGTESFAPPEQYGYSQTDCRSDIFSLGILLNWLLTGKTEPGKAAGSPLEKIILKCTAFDPARRYHDAAAVLRALKKAKPDSRKCRIVALTVVALLVVCAGIAGWLWWRSYQPMNDPAHTPAYITSQELQADAADYLNERYETTFFEATDSAGDVGYIRALLVNVFGYDTDYAYAMPEANPPMEVAESFLPWAFEDSESLSRDMAVYMVVKVFWPEVVGDWSSLKDDTGEYPGVRVAVPWAEKKGVLEGLNRPDHLTRGDLALLFANASRAYGEKLPPQLTAVTDTAVPTKLSVAGFEEPLMEQAVRAILNKSDTDPISEKELASIGELYIVGNRILPSQEEFYDAINDWYTAGRTDYGTIQTLNDVKLLPNLINLGLVAQQLSDITAIESLSALKKIEFKHNQIRNIGVLSSCPTLISVGLNDNPVKVLTPLLDCPNLRFLDLCGASNYNPDFLDDMGDFEFLDLSNETDSYLHLSGKSIRRLKLGWSNIGNLSCLDEVLDLEELELDNTAVTDLAPLVNHPTLKRLRLSGLAVSNLSVLKELPSLESVTLSQDMEPLVSKLGYVAFEIIYE